jgi:hypothetical protein
MHWYGPVVTMMNPCRSWSTHLHTNYIICTLSVLLPWIRLELKTRPGREGCEIELMLSEDKYSLGISYRWLHSRNTIFHLTLNKPWGRAITESGLRQSFDGNLPESHNRWFMRYFIELEFTIVTLCPCVASLQFTEKHGTEGIGWSIMWNVHRINNFIIRLRRPNRRRSLRFKRIIFGKSYV